MPYAFITRSIVARVPEPGEPMLIRLPLMSSNVLMFASWRVISVNTSG